MFQRNLILPTSILSLHSLVFSWLCLYNNKVFFYFTCNLTPQSVCFLRKYCLIEHKRRLKSGWYDIIQRHRSYRGFKSMWETFEKRYTSFTLILWYSTDVKVSSEEWQNKITRVYFLFIHQIKGSRKLDNHYLILTVSNHSESTFMEVLIKFSLHYLDS